MFKRFKFVVLLVLTSVNALPAATYYVSQTGSDSNNGSSSSPFLTIGKSISTATSPGDVVNIGAGTYSGTVTFNHAGTAGNPITFIGSGVVIAGNLNISANYVTVSGITDSPPSAGGYGAININDSYDILTNCIVENYGATASDQATAIILYGSYNLVVNCTVQNLNDIDAFHIFGHDQTLLGCTVTNLLELNYSENHTDYIQSYSYSGAVCYNILVKDCLCVNSTCQSMNLETDGNVNFYGWKFINDVWANVQNPAYCGIPQTLFLNCVFYKVAQNSSSGDQAISFYGIANYSSLGSEVINCVFLKDGSNPSSASLGGIGADGVSLSTMLIDHNYFAGNNYAAKSGAYIGTNPINGGDPKFLNEAGYDFHLLTNSVLIGAGINLSSIFTDDRDGNTRPSSGAWDVGAYAYTTNSGESLSPPSVAPQGLQIESSSP